MGSASSTIGPRQRTQELDTASAALPPLRQASDDTALLGDADAAALYSDLRVRYPLHPAGRSPDAAPYAVLAELWRARDGAVVPPPLFANMVYAGRTASGRSIATATFRGCEQHYATSVSAGSAAAGGDDVRISVHPAGELVVAATRRSVIVWHVASGTLLYTLGLADRFVEFPALPAGETMLVVPRVGAGRQSGATHAVRQCDGGSVAVSLPSTRDVRGVAFGWSPTSRWHVAWHCAATGRADVGPLACGAGPVLALGRVAADSVRFSTDASLVLCRENAEVRVYRVGSGSSGGAMWRCTVADLMRTGGLSQAELRFAAFADDDGARVVAGCIVEAAASPSARLTRRTWHVASTDQQSQPQEPATHLGEGKAHDVAVFAVEGRCGVRPLSESNVTYETSAGDATVFMAPHWNTPLVVHYDGGSGVSLLQAADCDSQELSVRWQTRVETPLETVALPPRPDTGVVVLCTRVAGSVRQLVFVGQ